jgi:hypothetical protein
MAPVKPMGTDRNPKGSKPGVTGFVQDYNEEPPPSQDLNPDAVTDDSVLPTPRTARTTADRPARAARKAAKKARR